MYLTALDIQGFKSFPDRTKIKIGKGITAVVGPNGSGKSNISDAIRWVMGETSAKQLRGGGKMEDIIFGGTHKRSAMGFAMVNLHVDNTDRRLDVESDEVIIGRKYYRSGDSEYSINGQNVRLKDVYELLLDTGIGKDGYAVIGQGRISEIVSAKSGERREIFEEASGIAKYRYRKNEAQKRLDSTENNLVRLRDILGELERQVGPLEKESEKAKKFLQLAQSKKELEVTLWVDTVHRAKDILREQQRKIDTANSDYEKITNDITVFEQEALSLRGEQERCIMQMNRLQEQITSAQELVAGAQTKIAVINNNIEHNNNAIENMKSEKISGEEGKKEIENQIKQHEENIVKCNEEIAQLEQTANRLNTNLDDLQIKNAKSGERRSVISQILTEITQRLTDYKVLMATAQSTIEAGQARLVAIEQNLEAAELNKSEAQKENSETTAFLEDAMQKKTSLENIKNGLNIKLTSRQNALTQADEIEQKLTKELDAALQRRQMLKELERSLDGYQNSVKAVLNAKENRRLRGIISPVAGIMSVKEGYEVAIETALGFALQNIIVENETAAKAAMAYLKENKVGRATFLPLDTMRPAYFDAKLTGSAVKASELVQYENKFSVIISNLLARIVVVDDINEASLVAKQLNYKNRIVTKDGQVINAGGSFTGGSVSKTSGMFSRKQEIDTLKEKIKQLEKQLEQAADKTDEAKEGFDALKAELNATESELITVNGDIIRAETESARLKTILIQAENAFENLHNEKNELQAQIELSNIEIENADNNINNTSAESEKLESELSQISDDDEFLQTRTRLADEISQVKLNIVSLQKDIENNEFSVKSLNMRTDDSGERQVQLDSGISALLEKNTAFENEIQGILNESKTSEDVIANLRAQIENLAKERLNKEGEERANSGKVKALTEQREGVSREMARLSEQKGNKENEYDQTIAKLWEEYELTLLQAEQICVDFESVANLKMQVADIRGKIKALGNVNVAAIEEYAQISERYEFLKTQVNDVEQSKKELIALITELSDEMRTMFAESFAQINKNFDAIFKDLFAGGSAKLSLEDDADVLESGITIEVAPPGKIIKNLSSLSGGEQSLVAISIYFAILQVNPAPFCVLDEIDAALDDVNVTRYAQFLKRITNKSQFIVITHRRGTMEEADVLYGVTMQEDGVSKLIKLDVKNVDASIIA